MLQLADSCGLTVFTLPRLTQSVQETQNESDLAFGKWDFEKFRGFLSPLPSWTAERLRWNETGTARKRGLLFLGLMLFFVRDFFI